MKEKFIKREQERTEEGSLQLKVDDMVYMPKGYLFMEEGEKARYQISKIEEDGTEKIYVFADESGKKWEANEGWVKSGIQKGFIQVREKGAGSSVLDLKKTKRETQRANQQTAAQEKQKEYKRAQPPEVLQEERVGRKKIKVGDNIHLRNKEYTLERIVREGGRVNFYFSDESGEGIVVPKTRLKEMMEGRAKKKHSAGLAGRKEEAAEQPYLDIPSRLEGFSVGEAEFPVEDMRSVEWNGENFYVAGKYEKFGKEWVLLYKYPENEDGRGEEAAHVTMEDFREKVMGEARSQEDAEPAGQEQWSGGEREILNSMLRHLKRTFATEESGKSGIEYDIQGDAVVFQFYYGENNKQKSTLFALTRRSDGKFEIEIPEEAKKELGVQEKGPIICPSLDDAEGRILQIFSFSEVPEEKKPEEQVLEREKGLGEWISEIRAILQERAQHAQLDIRQVNEKEGDFFLVVISPDEYTYRIDADILRASKEEDGSYTFSVPDTVREIIKLLKKDPPAQKYYTQEEMRAYIERNIAPVVDFFARAENRNNASDEEQKLLENLDIAAQEITKEGSLLHSAKIKKILVSAQVEKPFVVVCTHGDFTVRLSVDEEGNVDFVSDDDKRNFSHIAEVGIDDVPPTPCSPQDLVAFKKEKDEKEKTREENTREPNMDMNLKTGDTQKQEAVPLFFHDEAKEARKLREEIKNLFQQLFDSVAQKSKVVKIEKGGKETVSFMVQMGKNAKKALVDFLSSLKLGNYYEPAKNQREVKKEGEDVVVYTYFALKDKDWATSIFLEAVLGEEENSRKILDAVEALGNNFIDDPIRKQADKLVQNVKQYWRLSKKWQENIEKAQKKK